VIEAGIAGIRGEQRHQIGEADQDQRDADRFHGAAAQEVQNPLAAAAFGA
jgi:hypothetical protein